MTSPEDNSPYHSKEGVDKCRVECFRDDPPELYEPFRGKLSQCSLWPVDKYILIRAVMKEAGCQEQMIGKIVSFDVPYDKRKSVLHALYALSVRIHTLEDHIELLGQRMYSTKRQLGDLTYMHLPPGRNWRSLSQETRDWEKLSDKSTNLLVRDGSVIRSGDRPDFYYFWFVGSRFVPVQERAASNLGSAYFERSRVCWVDHEGVGTIFKHSLGIIPQDIFYSMARLRPRREYISEIFVFRIEDFEIVRQLLSFVNIELIRATKLIMLKGDVTKDKMQWTRVLSVETLPEGRVQSLVQTLESVGISCNLKRDSLEVSRWKNSLSLVFVEREERWKGFVDVSSRTIYIPLEVVSDFARSAKLVASILELLGLQSDEVDKDLSVFWRIYNDTDANNVLNVFTLNISDIQFLRRFMSSEEKKNFVIKWLSNAGRQFMWSSQTGKSVGNIYSVLKEYGVDIASN